MAVRLDNVGASRGSFLIIVDTLLYIMSCPTFDNEFVLIISIAG
jgi:hypothetical protein